MTDHVKRLQRIFKENQGLEAFRSIVRTMKENEVKLSLIHDPSRAGVGEHHCTTKTGEKTKRSLQINTAQTKTEITSDEVIRITLDHEGTHVKQGNIERVLVGENNCEPDSYLGLQCLKEGHAYSNEAEFAIERYLKKLETGDAAGSFEEKAFDGFFEVYADGSFSINRFLKQYITGMVGEDLKLETASQVRDALQYYHHKYVMTGHHTEKNIKNGRKAVLKGFFEPEPVMKALPDGPKKNSFVLDHYVGSVTSHLDENHKYYASEKRKRVSLDTAAMIFTTGSDLFLEPEEYEEVLGISSLNELNEKALRFSKHKEAFETAKQKVAQAKQRKRHSESGFDFDRNF